MIQTFPKIDLQQMLYEDSDYLELVETTVDDVSRWSIHKTAIFKNMDDGKYYKVDYSVGATEQQDEGPFEYDPDTIECKEVVKKTITIEQFVEV